MSISLACHIVKPRLDRNSMWHFMVPEGTSSTHDHTQGFIRRGRLVTDCHVSSNMMEELGRLTLTQKLQLDGEKITYTMSLTSSVGPSENTSPSVSPVYSFRSTQSVTPKHSLTSCCLHICYLIAYFCSSS